MKTKIKYCTEDFLTYYKANFQTELLPYYLDGDKDGIRRIFNKDMIYDGDLEVTNKPLFQPKDFDKGSGYIKENSKIVYTMLKNLTQSQAAKEELWFTMANTVFLDYTIEYIKSLKQGDNFAKRAMSVVFFMLDNTTSRVSQHIAKFWWIGSKTYDRKAENNPFWLTDFFADYDPSGKSQSFFGSKFTNNKNFRLGILEGVKEVVEKGMVRNSKETYVLINEHFNFVGGARILDIMSRNEVKLETIQFVEDLFAGKIEISDRKKNLILVNATKNQKTFSKGVKPNNDEELSVKIEMQSDIKENQIDSNDTLEDSKTLTELNNYLNSVESKTKVKSNSEDSQIKNAFTVNSTEDLLLFLEKERLEFVDKRSNNGALWIVGGREIGPILEPFEEQGYKFCFSEKGGRASKNRSAWFTK